MSDPIDMIWTGAKTLSDNAGVALGAAGALTAGFSVTRWFSELINSTFNANNLLVNPYVKSETQEKAEEMIPLIEEVLSHWPSTMKGKLRPSHVQAIMTLFAEAYTTATEEKKQALLQNALVNAFDPTLYQQGITRRLFKIMRDLEYGDIFFLRVISPYAPEQIGLSAIQDSLPDTALAHHHAKVLIDAGVAFTTNLSFHNQSWYTTKFGIGITAVGKQLLTLVENQNSSSQD